MRTIQGLYDHEDAGIPIDVPQWFAHHHKPTASDVAAIIEGGCASGAWMPAVTYVQARETMLEHGDEILEYLEEQHEYLQVPFRGMSWDGLACFYVSAAVETWCHENAEAILERLNDEDGGEDEDEDEDEATIYRGHALDLSAVEWKLRALDGISRTLEEKLGGPE